jgi:BirA family biotin operon repressor/biotin-[acetyl-CoA-carboxylase] ligase
MQAEFDRVNSVIIGVGVNVNHAALPDELRDSATSLRLASGRDHSRMELLIDVLEELENLLTRFEQSGPAAIIEAWTACSSYATGRPLQIHNGFHVIEGTTDGLNSFGALRLKTGDGRIEEIYSGEIVK